ncbi:MAG: LacI family DNA-binding transcriptional regulator [Lachnospiraceae bacterium]|nr:LacI family DNA-binding transcriptional regulator [Lachnospiraceae bacterium]
MESTEKKVTVKDVAREAGVSVATVSYIMNNRADQKISPATKKKVLQIANLLNYKPNHAAKSLAQGRNNIIGITYVLDPKTPARNLEITTFTNLLIPQLARRNYDVLFLKVPDPHEDAFINRNVDAILAIDLTHEAFRALAEAYLVPIIGIDMIINDSLFYQVYSDYPTHIREAATLLGTEDYYLLTDGFSNMRFLSFLQDSLPKERIVFYSKWSSETQQMLQDKKVIVLGTYLGLIVHPFLPEENLVVISSEQTAHLLPPSLRIIRNDIDKKANLAINLLLNALDRKFEVSHDFKVK